MLNLQRNESNHQRCSSVNATIISFTSGLVHLESCRDFNPVDLQSFWSAAKIETSGQTQSFEHAQRACVVF